ncbi:hypothetical protein [Mesobacillus thioparans]|uniref:hypothetical protein n=1 Tax=Mesobacillus thioparans TaxID=370439 RepID=UPI0039EFF78F
MNVILENVNPEQKHVLRNLHSLYLHDLSTYTNGLTISEDGSFEFDSFSFIWEKVYLQPGIHIEEHVKMQDREEVIYQTFLMV